MSRPTATICAGSSCWPATSSRPTSWRGGCSCGPSDLDPDFARALAGIAECDCDLYMHFGEPASFDDVLAVTERALQLEPDLASAHASRGVALLATGRAEEAERSFQQPSRPSPTMPWRTTSMAAPAFELGRMQEAVRLLRRAADLAPDDVGFLSPLPDGVRGTRHEGGGRGDLARGPGAMRTGTGAAAGPGRRGLPWRRCVGVLGRARASPGLGQARARNRARRPPDALQCRMHLFAPGATRRSDRTARASHAGSVRPSNRLDAAGRRSGPASPASALCRTRKRLDRPA